MQEWKMKELSLERTVYQESLFVQHGLLDVKVVVVEGLENQ